MESTGRTHQNKEASMYASVRQYRLVPGTAAEFNRQVNEGFLPLVRDSEGFVSYQGIDAGQDRWLSVTVFESKGGAEASAALAADFVAKHLEPMIQGSPDILTGDLIASARS
jgi:hypothetical protein